MASIWDEPARHDLLARVERLTPDSTARWGKLNCVGMLAHVNDALRMVIGEVNPPLRRTPLRFFPLKQLIIYVFPFPRGAPSAPLLFARGSTAVFRDEVGAFGQILQRVAGRSADTTWPDHPAFGRMSRRDWGALGYKHIDHHFTQFGV
jgi:hypothetical protein